MGADIVIAVDLNSDVVGAAWRTAPGRSARRHPASWHRKLLSRLGRNGAAAADDTATEPEGLPSMLTVMQSSISIMSVRIARSRLAGEPADVLISPRLAQLGLMDYHRGAEAIAEGEAAVELALPSIRRALGR
jgi:NTE family protein